MAKHYTPEQKLFALERIIANWGSVTRTAEELNISKTTLYRWRQREESGKTPRFGNFPFLPNLPSHTTDSALFPIFSKDDDLATLVSLKMRMIDLVDYIMAADKIKQAVDEAPLSQRVVALVQLTDRIIKLAAQLHEQDVEYVFRLTGEPEKTDEENDRTADHAAEVASESDQGL